MDKTTKVSIRSGPDGKTSVTVGGVPLEGVVRKLEFIHNANEIPVLRLDLIGCDLTIDEECQPELPDNIADFVRRVIHVGDLAPVDR